MKTSDFHYDLPKEYIAQFPADPRDSSRLLAFNRQTGVVQHSRFHHLGEFLKPNDLLVLNQTRVIPARLFGHKIPTGGKVELLLLTQEDEHTWKAFGGGSGLRAGKKIQITDGPQAEIVQVLNGPLRLVRFSEPIEPFFEQAGHVPLPPYIHEKLDDPERYQTVYAEEVGSAAAPTAGLHFTPPLLERLRQMGVQFASVTLHVGLDTFAPVHEETPQEHKIHTEWCQVTPQAAQKINQARNAGGRVIAVGTTSVRTLESAAQRATGDQVVASFEGPTNLFILPGYQFQAVDAMITNFHLPESTLLMLVSAFVGRERILEIYEIAKQEKYRFYSFGDAMLLE